MTIFRDKRNYNSLARPFVMDMVWTGNKLPIPD